MPEVKKEETHQTVTTVFFSDTEVASILGQAALDDSRSWPSKPSYPQRSVPGRRVELEITQETEGSPGYNVKKWRARVVVTQDHLFADSSESEMKEEKKP